MGVLPAVMAVVLSSGCGLVLDTDPTLDGRTDRARVDDGGSVRDTATTDATSVPTDAEGTDSTDAASRDATVAEDAGPPACAPLVPPPRSTAALSLVDLTDIDACGAPSLDVGFRCKSYVFCGESQPCYYGFEDRNLGHLQSSEATYRDGTELAEPEPTVFVIGVGANSLCMDPVITIRGGDFLRIRDDAGNELDVWLPDWTGRELRLFVGVDGHTYWDAARTMPAGAPP